MVARRFGRRKSAGDHIGIAVGSHGLVAVRVGDSDGVRPRVLGSAFFPSGNEGDWADGMRKLVRDLDGKRLPATVVPHQGLVSLLQLSLPPTPDGERVGALKFRAREVSQIDVEDMLLDYVEVSGARVRGSEPPCYCAIASRARMTDLRDAVLAAGFDLRAIEVADTALCHLLARLAGQGEAIAGMLLATQGLRLVIVNEGGLSLFRSSTLNVERLRDDLESHLDQLLLEMQRTIDFYDSNYTTPLPRRLLLLPAWPFAPRLAELLAPSLRVRPEVLDPDEVIADAARADGPAPDLSLLAIAAALRPASGGVG